MACLTDCVGAITRTWHFSRSHSPHHKFRDLFLDTSFSLAKTWRYARLPGLCIWFGDIDVSGNWTCFLDNRSPLGLFSDKRGLWHAVGLWVGVAFVSLLLAPFRELKHDVVAVVVGGWVTYLTTGTFKEMLHETKSKCE